MPDQDYWIVNWKVGSLVHWSGAGSVRNLAFLDLIVNKSQKPIKAFLLDGNQSNRASQNSLMECDARSGLLDCWLKGWQSGSLVWSRFSQKPRISRSNSKQKPKTYKGISSRWESIKPCQPKFSDGMRCQIRITGLLTERLAVWFAGLEQVQSETSHFWI